MSEPCVRFFDHLGRTNVDEGSNPITRPARRRASGDVSRAHDAARPYGHARSAQRGYARGRVVSRRERWREGSRLDISALWPLRGPGSIQGGYCDQGAIERCVVLRDPRQFDGRGGRPPGLSPHRADAPCDRGWAHFVYPLHAAHDRRDTRRNIYLRPTSSTRSAIAATSGGATISTRPRSARQRVSGSRSRVCSASI